MMFITRWWLIVCGLTAAAAAQTTQSARSEPGDLHRLAKVFARAEAGKPIRIAVLGGSIAQGSAASKPEFRYANRVQAWFRKMYPDSDVSLLNAGIADTGVDYGCLRVQRDVLANVPDLVIVDFSVDTNNDPSARMYEGVIRQVLGAANQPALLLMFNTWDDGTSSQDIDAKLGRHYHLPMVSVHDALFEKLAADHLHWKDISPDHNNLNDKGMAYAAACITDFLMDVRSERPAGGAAPIPRPLLSDRYADTELAQGEGLSPTTQQGWTLDHATHCWSANQPGATFEASMPGRDLFFLDERVRGDAGVIRVTVDGVEKLTASGGFPFGESRRQTSIIAGDLPNTSHKIKLELLNDMADGGDNHRYRFFGVGSAGDVDQPLARSGAYAWRNVPIVGGGFVTGIIPHPTEKGLLYARTDIGGAYRRSAAEHDWVPMTDWIDQAHWTWTGIESLAADPSDPRCVYLAAGSYTNDWGAKGAFLCSADQGRTWQVTPVDFKMGGNENGRGMGERLNVDPHDGNVLLFGSRKNGLWRSGDRAVSWSPVTGFPDQGDTHGIGICLTFFDVKSKAILAGTGNMEHCLYRSDDGGQSWRPLAGAPKGLMPHHVAEDADGAIYITFSNGPGPNGVTDGAVDKLNLADDSFTAIRPVQPSAHDSFGYGGVTVDPKRPGVVMVSTIDRWNKGDQIYRSLDGGETWMALRDKMQRDPALAPWLQFDSKPVGIGHWIADLEIDPSDSNHLLYVTGWGMWEARDLTAADQLKPTHWKVAAKGIEECVVNDLISPPDDAHLLSVMWDIDGFRHSDPGAAGTNFKPNFGGNTSIDFAEARPETIVRVYGDQPVGGSSGGGNGGSVSNDNGKTWTPFVTRPNDDDKSGTVAISCDAKTIVWTPSTQPGAVTHDRGATWKTCGGLPDKARVIADRETANVFYAIDSTRGIALISEDGGETFQPGATDLPGGESFLASVPSKPGELWMATEKGLLVSYDSARTFKAVGDFSAAHRIGFGRARFDDATHPAIYVVGTRTGVYGFFRSDDRGESWTRINDDEHQFGEIAAIIGDPRQFGRVYVASRNRGILVGDPK